MAARLSTGLVNKMLGTSSFKDTFALGFIDIYTGVQPTSADAIPTGTRLGTLYSDGTATGLSWGDALLGALPKATGETWSTILVNTGTAGWFRLREATDTGVDASTTAARYDGAIATSGAEMNLGTLALLTGAPFVISAANFTLPRA